MEVYAFRAGNDAAGHRPFPTAGMPVFGLELYIVI
jgi:hypothetical protein